MLDHNMVNKIRAIPQQGINSKGDCGQCCLAGITNKSVKEIYQIQGVIDGLTYFSMMSLIKKLGIKYNNKLPYLDDWRMNEEWQTFGRPSYMLTQEWLENAYSRTLNGWIGLCGVNLNGKAIEEEIADHWVLLYKITYDPQKLYKEKNVYISCPTKGERIFNAKDFLKNYGGYNTIWVKPLIK